LPQRHRVQNAQDQERRLSTIADPQRRKATRDTVEKYYEAWNRALKKAYAMRYDLSPRLYERRVADPEKEKMHGEAKRETIAASQMRMKDINHVLPLDTSATSRSYA
jgi:hypothetical protein